MTETLDEILDEDFDPDDLLPWEKQVKKGALEGKEVPLHAEALRGETEEDGPTIRARFLEMLLLGQLGGVHHRGVRFSSYYAPKDKPARVIGALNLRGAGAAGQPLPILQIHRFGFEQRPNFDMAHLTFLALNGCQFSDGIDLQRAHIRGGLFLDRIQSQGEINLNSASIGGQLVLEGAKLTNKADAALNANGATIGGGSFLRRIEATGEVDFRGATIGGTLALEGAKLVHEEGTALDADGAMIGGGAVLTQIEAWGEVNFRGATIGGQLVLVGAKLTNKVGIALGASTATIEGSVFAKSVGGDHGLVSWGEVNFHTARIKGAFEWNGAVLLAGTEGRPALVAPNLDLQGQAHFQRDQQGRPFVALGGVTFSGAKFHDPVRWNEALLVAPAVIDRTGIDQWRTLSLDDGSAAGDLRFQNATILGAAVFDGRAVTGDIHFDDAALVPAGSTKRDEQDGRPWGERVDETKEGVALSMVRSTVKGALQMRHFKKPDPTILDKIEIKPLDPEFFGPEASEEFANAFKEAIAKTKDFMEKAQDTCSQVEGTDDHHPQGHFLLWNADIGSLQDDCDRSYPKELGLLHIDGLRYRHLDVKPRHEDPQRRWVGDRRVAWLRRQYPDGKAKEGSFHPQPYDQLAATLRAQGYGRAANTVGAEKRKDARRAKAEQWWDREVVSRAYSVTSNSGYSTVRITIAYFIALAAAIAVNAMFFASEGLVATKSSGLVDPKIGDIIGYTVDKFVPLLRFGADQNFKPTDGIAGVLAGFCVFATQIIGLILTGILALTYTGVTRKD